MNCNFFVWYLKTGRRFIGSSLPCGTSSCGISGCTNCGVPDYSLYRGCNSGSCSCGLSSCSSCGHSDFDCECSSCRSQRRRRSSCWIYASFKYIKCSTISRDLNMRFDPLWFLIYWMNNKIQLLSSFLFGYYLTKSQLEIISFIWVPETQLAAFESL